MAGLARHSMYGGGKLFLHIVHQYTLVLVRKFGNILWKSWQIDKIVLVGKSASLMIVMSVLLNKQLNNLKKRDMSYAKWKVMNEKVS